jgi:hypothetical protein
MQEKTKVIVLLLVLVILAVYLFSMLTMEYKKIDFFEGVSHSEVTIKNDRQDFMTLYFAKERA